MDVLKENVMKMTIISKCCLLNMILAAPLVFATEHEIIQLDKKFNVQEITIKPGDSIKFKNKEKDITHNVFSLGPKNAFELKSQLPGQESKVEFKEPGTTEVECAIHQTMKLKVTVKK